MGNNDLEDGIKTMKLKKVLIIVIIIIKILHLRKSVYRNILYIFIGNLIKLLEVIFFNNNDLFAKSFYYFFQNG